MATNDTSPPEYWVDQDYEAGERFEGGAAVKAVAAVLFARADGPAPDARLRWLASRVQDMRERIGGRGMFVFRVAVLLAMWAAPLWSLRVPPLSRHEIPVRARVLERWERSPFGMSLFAIKAILCIAWFEHPAEAAAMRFDGRPLIEGDRYAASSTRASDGAEEAEHG